MAKLPVTQRVALALARWSGLKLAQRLYGGARITAQTYGFGGGNTSADAELATSLALLRSRSRVLMRDSSHAKRARNVIVNNVVGAGVGMQAQVMTTRDELATRVNDDIERVWAEWARAECCHTGGVLHFADLERAALAEVVTAGEVLIRRHYRTFGASRVPYALELIEPERLDDLGAGVTGSNVRMGVEVDDFGRPVAYRIRRRHPGDRRWQGAAADEVVRVPAAEVFHLRLVDRWPMTRGEPWLHAVIRKLDDMDQYSAAELAAARASAYYFATIESGDEMNPLVSPADEPSTLPPQMQIDPLTVQQLAPGEKLQFHKPDRPNTALDAFLRAMLREIAAGLSVSYESLSRDYSQSNYSSSRLALLDDRDTWRMLQQWWIRSFREPLHRDWLQQAVFAGAVPAVPVSAYAADRARYEAVLFKPRGWSWVDPTKEVDAYVTAIKAGLTTLTDVIAQTANGQDIEDVIGTRKRELQMLVEAGIDVETTVKAAVAAPPPPPAAPEPTEDDLGDPAADAPTDTSRPARLVSSRS